MSKKPLRCALWCEDGKRREIEIPWELYKYKEDSVGRLILTMFYDDRRREIGKVIREHEARKANRKESWLRRLFK